MSPARSTPLRPFVPASVLTLALLIGAAPWAPMAGQVPEDDEAGPEVAFMQDMILHHAQALEMSRLAPDRSENEQVLALTRRIEAAQGDEIALMKRWLERRGHRVPTDEEIEDHARGMPEDHHHPDPEEAHHHEGAGGMAGMLSRQDFRALEDAEGTDFDRLFLEKMIHHHQGAIIMVEELLETPQAVADSEVFSLATHVETMQQGEITRMQAMLRDMGNDATTR